MDSKRNWRVVLTLFLAAMSLGALASPSAEAYHVLYSIDVGANIPCCNFLRVIDSLTAATISQVPITLSNRVVLGGTGLATDPTTGKLYALLRLGSQFGRELVTVDPASGIATDIGDTDTLGDKFAGIAFDSAGTLYGITGDFLGSPNPETLFIIDKTNAALTPLLTLGRGDSGEAIAFNPDDGLMYHASGRSGNYDPMTNTGVIFESINLNALTVTDIPIAGTDLVSDEVEALTYWPGEGVFLWKQGPNAFGGGPLFRVTPGGVPTLIGFTDHPSKGLAFDIPEPSTITLLIVGLACVIVIYRRMKKQRPQEV